MFQNMKMSTRLVMLAAIACVLLLVPIADGVYQLYTLKTSLANSLSIDKTENEAVLAVVGAQVAFKTQVQDWKDTLLRGNDPKNFDNYFGQFAEEEKKVQVNLKNAIDLMQKRGMPIGDVENLIKAHQELGRRYREAIATYDKSHPTAGQEVDKLVKGMDRDTATGMGKVVKQIVEHSSQTAAVEIERADVRYRDIRNVLIFFGVIGVALMIGISAAIIRSLLKQLGGDPAYAAEITQLISKGDLTVHINLEAGDDSSLLANMRHMQENLRAMVGQVLDNTGHITDAASELANTSQQVSVGTQQQSVAVAAMASDIEEMTVSFEHVSSNAGKALTIANNAGDLSTQGGTVVYEAVAEMNKIAESVNQSAKIIQTLGEHSGEISAIVHVIKDIADQTNLLALNAAIEAARAGEQGRGFAVVADEVRKLAERTTQSTQEISSMIDTIQNGTQNAISSMQEGSNRVSQGVAMANRAGDSMQQIRDGANQVVSEVNDITAALREQTTASTQVARNVEKIARMTEENSAAVGKIAGAAGNLKAVAGSLQEMVGKFKV